MRNGVAKRPGFAADLSNQQSAFHDAETEIGKRLRIGPGRKRLLSFHEGKKIDQ